MKTLKDLKLKPRDKKKVKNWLNELLQHYIEKADGRTGTVERANFEELDLFYFTDCRDEIGKNPEALGKETNKKIRKRKEFVRMQLFLRYLLGEKLGKDRPCSHCGNSYRFINAFDNTGHYVFCDKCKMTTIVTYPDGYNTFIPRMIEDLKEHGYTLYNQLERLAILKKEIEDIKKTLKSGD